MRMQLMGKATLIGVAMALLLAGCGGAKKKASSTTPRPSLGTSSATATAKAQATATPSATPRAAAVPTSGPGITEPLKACQPREVKDDNSGQPGQTYIAGGPTSTASWGSHCMSLETGEFCRVKWNGSWQILTSAKAYIEYQVWSKEKKDKAEFTHTVGPLPEVGQFSGWEFPLYVPKATEIYIRLVLRDQAKLPVAVGNGFVYAVNCKP